MRPSLREDSNGHATAERVLSMVRRLRVVSHGPHRWRPYALTLICAAGLGCDSAPDTSAKILRSGSAQRESKPYAVFVRPTLVIDRLNTPVAAPVSAGSQPSSATMVSDAPAIVSIDVSGSLVAHGNGSTIVRAKGTGSLLQVQVLDVKHLSATPEVLRLNAGQDARVRVTGSDDVEIPPSAVSWSTSAPEIASASNGTVYAGSREGTATLVAQYGGRNVLVRARVTAADAPVFSIRPHKPLLHAGEIVGFQALSRSGPLEAEWHSSNPSVVAHLAGGMFRASDRGESLVCATAPGRRACTTVGVER